MLQERIKEQEKEMKHVCESASQRQHQLLEEQRIGEAHLQSALQELQQNTQELNLAQSNILQLQEESATLQEEVRHISPPPPPPPPPVHLQVEVSGGLLTQYCKWAIDCHFRNGFNRQHIYSTSEYLIGRTSY